MKVILDISMTVFVNPFATGNTHVCGALFKPADDITVNIVPRKHFFKILF